MFQKLSAEWHFLHRPYVGDVDWDLEGTWIKTNLGTFLRKLASLKENGQVGIGHLGLLS